MKKAASLWTVALLITVATAYYQRVTGPSYPLTGSVHFKNEEVRYRLPRSHGGSSDALIQIQTGDSSIEGYVQWKRFKTGDPWTRDAMTYSKGSLTVELPHQPPAGKLQYSVALSRGDEVAVLPGEEPVVIRFKGDVPLWVLIPHIIAMFAAMLLAARTGLEYFREGGNLKSLTYWTIGVLAVGGFILGPTVQYYAFDAWWTGWPAGTDLTDNKTAVALLAWIVVGVALRKSKNAKVWALAAAIITFVVFLIPHSLLGSELDYNAADARHARIDTVRNE